MTEQIEEDIKKEEEDAGKKAFLALCCCSYREYEDQGT